MSTCHVSAPVASFILLFSFKFIRCCGFKCFFSRSLFSLCAGHAVATPSSVAALWSVRPALAADVTSPPCLLMAANLSVVFVHPGEVSLQFLLRHYLSYYHSLFSPGRASDVRGSAAAALEAGGAEQREQPRRVRGHGAAGRGEPPLERGWGGEQPPQPRGHQEQQTGGLDRGLCQTSSALQV